MNGARYREDTWALALGRSTVSAVRRDHEPAIPLGWRAPDRWQPRCGRMRWLRGQRGTICSLAARRGPRDDAATCLHGPISGPPCAAADILFQYRRCRPRLLA